MKVIGTTAASCGNGCSSRATSSVFAAAPPSRPWPASADITSCTRRASSSSPEALTVEVEFIVSPEEAQKLLDLLHKEKVRLFYAYTPACFGVINPDASDPPSVADCSRASRIIGYRYAIAHRRLGVEAQRADEQAMLAPVARLACELRAFHYPTWTTPGRFQQLLLESRRERRQPKAASQRMEQPPKLPCLRERHPYRHRPVTGRPPYPRAIPLPLDVDRSQHAGDPPCSRLRKNTIALLTEEK